MGSVRKKGGQRRVTPAPKADGKLRLPTSKAKPPNDLTQYRVFIYGEGGVGKSSLMARFGGKSDTLFFQFELASTGLEIFRTPLLADWGMVREFVSMLKAGDHNYGAVCFDTGTPAYERCLEWVCKKRGVTHPHDANDFGATWKAVTDEYRGVMRDLAQAGLVVTVVAHDKLSEIETRTGQRIWRIEPNMGGKCLQYFRENSDVIGYYHMVGRYRYLQIMGDDYVMAKANPENHFRTPAGDRIVRIPMGDSADEAYHNLILAFNNKQKETHAEVIANKALTEETASRQRRKHSKQRGR